MFYTFTRHVYEAHHSVLDTCLGESKYPVRKYSFLRRGYNIFSESDLSQEEQFWLGTVRVTLATIVFLLCWE